MALRDCGKPCQELLETPEKMGVYFGGDEIEELSEQVDCIAQKELSLLLEHAICVLPERNRQIVYMKYYRDMTSQEIASRLHVSSGNVRIILKRSLAKMQEVLKSVI